MHSLFIPSNATCLFVFSYIVCWCSYRYERVHCLDLGRKAKSTEELKSTLKERCRFGNHADFNFSAHDRITSRLLQVVVILYLHNSSCSPCKLAKASTTQSWYFCQRIWTLPWRSCKCTNHVHEYIHCSMITIPPKTTLYGSSLPIIANSFYSKFTWSAPFHFAVHYLSFTVSYKLNFPFQICTIEQQFAHRHHFHCRTPTLKPLLSSA